MRWTRVLAILGACVAVAGCGGGTQLVHRTTESSGPTIVVSGSKLSFPAIATKNTTRVAGSDPVADAAAVALAVYPSTTSGTHPRAVTIAPTADWQAAIASSVLMASPIRAPLLLSGSSSLPAATARTLDALAPSGSGAVGGAQVIRV